jgi:hypothetical protein
MKKGPDYFCEERSAPRFHGWIARINTAHRFGISSIRLLVT